MARHSVAACCGHLIFFECVRSVSARCFAIERAFGRTYARADLARFFTQFRGRLIGRTPAFGAGYHGSSPCPGAIFPSHSERLTTSLMCRSRVCPSSVVVDCRPLSHGEFSSTTVLPSDRRVRLSMGGGAHRPHVSQETPRPHWRRYPGLHLHRRSYPHAPRADHRLHLFDGGQPLRSTQKF